MAAATSNQADKRYAVVTGANKGIGFGICKQLASHGIIVVLTARDQKRGLDALENLKAAGFSDNVLFHQLDVANSGSVASLAEFVKTQFGRLDILVNNAGVVGVTVDTDALSAARTAAGGKTTGVESVEEGAASPVRLAILPDDDDDAPSGAFLGTNSAAPEPVELSPCGPFWGHSLFAMKCLLFD